MTLISLIEASKDFGIRSLFSNLTLHIAERERIGLIGPNGAGKSTLLKVLSGAETLEQGHRQCSPKLHLEAVNQETSLGNTRTVLQEVLRGCGIKRQLLERFHELTTKVAKNPEKASLISALGEVSHQMDETNAWDLEQECKEILTRLGITNLNQPVNELSGGYLKRINLAAALVSKPDLLLLDEPTNHLDTEAVEWLQNWLKNFQGAIVLVTHDRYFLDQIVTKIIEVSEGRAYKFTGNYSQFLQHKSHIEDAELSSNKKLTAILRKELAWLRKGAKARSTKQKARVQRIELMRKRDVNSTKKTIEIASEIRRLGKLVIETDNLKITNDETLTGQLILKNLNHSFEKRDRIGIIGKNGIGKSSLLDVIAGIKRPADGVLKIGETVKVGYLDQHTEDLSKGKQANTKVIDFIKESAWRVKLFDGEITASQLLERFLFSPAEQNARLSKLSGGEQRRLTLCRILIQSPNVLLLDEPTNDLDINTLRILEDYLETFPGCVIVVSHDRYFLDRTINRILFFENKELHQFEGTYSDFLEHQKKLLKTKEVVNQSSDLIIRNPSQRNTNSKNEKQGPRKLSYKESLELEELNRKIPLLEKKREALEKEIAENHKDLNSISIELAENLETLYEAEERWLELSDLIH